MLHRHDCEADWDFPPRLRAKPPARVLALCVTIIALIALLITL